MRLSLALTLAIWLRCPLWAAVVVAPVASIPVSPLVQLGVLLQPTLAAPVALSAPAPVAGLPSPSFSLPQAPAAPAAIPVIDSQRAQVLASRSIAAASAKPAAQTPGAPAASAADVLVAVNGVLRDFTPRQLESMPAEDLQALSSLILDQLPGSARAGGDDVRGIRLVAQARASKVMAQRGKGLQETLENPKHTESHPDQITVQGVPDNVAQEREGAVYRHYTTEDGLRSIQESARLRNGYVSYVQRSPGLYHKSYPELTGLFLTKPNVKGDQVGVPAKEFNRYVDVRLPAGVPVLEVEKGTIWVIPLPARVREWVMRYYKDWVEGRSLPDMYRRMIERVHGEGGPGAGLDVPVQIVGSGKAR